MPRYSHSKVDQFKTCPKKYDYQYKQDLNPIEDSIHLSVGKLTHSAIEARLKFQDPQPYYDEFAGLVRKGLLPHCTEKTLERVIQWHTNYYAEEDQDREYIMVEHKFEEVLNEEEKDPDKIEIFSGMVDSVFTKPDTYFYLEDHKTTINKLKYQESDVRLNRQLHKYAKVLEKDYFININYLIIDEIVIRELDQVPLLQSGKPTKDTKQLGFVLYEDYMDMLEMLGLEKEQAYQGAIAYLKDRGHPLFRRTIVELNESIMNNIAEEYEVAINAIKGENFYRVKSPLCNYCAFQDICTMELQGGFDEYVKELKEKNFKPTEIEEDEEFK